jgi:hypothetical protein
MKMIIKDIWMRTSTWLRNYNLAKVPYDRPQTDDQGLMTEDIDSAELPVDGQSPRTNSVVVKTIQPKSKSESLEKLQAGFDRLVDKLQGINEHLNHQITQNEELMSRIEQLPKLLESFPALLDNQKLVTEELLEQLRAAAAKNQQFVEAVEKIPAETAKQTNALVEIDNQLAAAADVDVQMAESFNKFNEALEKLNQNTCAQADSITQMGKTFAASDRYLKYIISRQNKRFMWIFGAAVSVCVAVVLILIGIIIYLRR